MAKKTKLSGGVFYSILIDGKLSGHKEGNTNPDLLAGLIRFFDDQYSLGDQSSNTISKYCAQYRDGLKTHGAGLPFDQVHLTSSFHGKLQTNYGFYHTKMSDFVKNHMTKSSDIKTVRSILKCLESDDSIDDGQQFLTGFDGSAMSKSELLQQSIVCYETFLLGIWDFIVTNRPTEVGNKDEGVYREIQVKRSDEWEITIVNSAIPPVQDEFSFSPWEQSGFELTEWNEELIQNIERHRRLYVRTKAIEILFNHLRKEHIAFLIGDPGSGKTIATEIIAYLFMSDGVNTICTYDYKDTERILNLVRENRDACQIILIDDCMGQAYYDLGEEQETALRRLISAVAASKNKYLLLNSRITICNSARSRDDGLAKRINEHAKSIISLPLPSELERATIYFKHLLYSDPIKNEHYFDLQPDKRYREIINHKNYTPRIMEYVTSDLFLRNTSPSDYYKLVMQTLERPAKIWDDEFNRKLQKRDRLLLTTLFSLTTDKCRTVVCRMAYEKRIALEPDIDSSQNNWDRAVAVLNGSMIKHSVIDEVDYISVSNPSVNDYLRFTIMCSGSSEWKAIESSIVAIKQIENLDVIVSERNRIIAEKGKDGTIQDLIYDSEDEKSYFIALSTVYSEVQNKAYSKYIYHCFETYKCSSGFILDFDWLGREQLCRKIVMNDRLRDYYLPGKKLVSAINLLITNCSRFYLFDLLESFISLPVKLYDPSDPDNKKHIYEAINMMLDEASNDSWDKINDVAAKQEYYDPRWIAEDVNQEIVDNLYSDGPDAEVFPDFICDYFENEMSNREFCTEEDVEQALKHLYDEPDYDDMEYGSSDSGPDDIAEMFERSSLK